MVNFSMSNLLLDAVKAAVTAVVIGPITFSVVNAAAISNLKASKRCANGNSTLPRLNRRKKDRDLVIGA